MVQTRRQTREILKREPRTPPRQSKRLRGFSPGGTSLVAEKFSAPFHSIPCSISGVAARRESQRVPFVIKTEPGLDEEFGLESTNNWSTALPDDIPLRSKKQLFESIAPVLKKGQLHVINGVLSNDSKIRKQVDGCFKKDGKRKKIKAEIVSVFPTTTDAPVSESIITGTNDFKVKPYHPVKKSDVVMPHRVAVSDKATIHPNAAGHALNQWEAEKQRAADFRELYLSPTRKQPVRACRSPRRLTESMVALSRQRLEFAQTPCRNSRFRIVAGWHVCNHCYAEFGTEGDLSVHMKTKHTTEIICGLCRKRFEKRNQLVAHLHTEHWHCKHCSEVFPDKKRLQMHSVVHVEEHYCAQCRRSYRNSQGYQQHVRSAMHMHIEQLVREAYRIGATQADPDSVSIETGKPRFVKDKSQMKIHEVPLLELLKSPNSVRPSFASPTMPVATQSPSCSATGGGVVQSILDSASAMTPRSRAFYLHEMNNVNDGTQPETREVFGVRAGSQDEVPLPVFGGEFDGSANDFVMVDDGGFDGLFVPNYETVRNDERREVSGLLDTSFLDVGIGANWDAANTMLLDDDFLFNPNQPAVFTGFDSVEF